MTVKANFGPALRKLARLRAKLERLQAGDPAAETAVQLGEEIGAAIVLALGPHRRSGNAESSIAIETSAKGVIVHAPYYLKFHQRTIAAKAAGETQEGWWEPFSKAGITISWGSRSIVVWKERVRALLGGA